MRVFTVGSVVPLTPADQGFPPRAPNLSELTPLVSLFSRYPDLLPFVRYLLNEHRIFTVADWDECVRKPFETFQLSDALKRTFINKIGRPVRPVSAKGAMIVALRAVQSPA
jgi:hypothetical protein